MQTPTATPKGGTLRAFRSAGIPYVDRSVEHTGVSKLRNFNATNLGKLNKTLVIQENDTPLAVLVNYEQYLIIQDQLQAALDTIQMLRDKAVAAGVITGLVELSEGKTTPIEEIDPEFATT